MSTYKFSDGVISRIAQILQEAILLGVDIVDILRQVEVHPNSDGTALELTPEYSQRVVEMHRKLVEEALVKQETQNIISN
jgi:hypothetical protein